MSKVGNLHFKSASQLIRGVRLHSTGSGGRRGSRLNGTSASSARRCPSRAAARAARKRSGLVRSAFAERQCERQFLPTDYRSHPACIAAAISSHAFGTLPALPSREVVDRGHEAASAELGGELAMRSFARLTGVGQVLGWSRGASLGHDHVSRKGPLGVSRTITARGCAAEQADAADEAHGGW